MLDKNYRIIDFSSKIETKETNKVKVWLVNLKLEDEIETTCNKVDDWLGLFLSK